MLINLRKHILIAFAILPFKLWAQENPAAAVIESDTLQSTVAKLSSEIDFMKRFKVTGYLQAQYQYADSSGEYTFAGGAFASKDDSRFMIRRGRVKFGYYGELTQFSMQLDGTQNGVQLMDIYAKITDPWTHNFTFTIGIFNRPFGYEIAYSSVDRETPERMRLNQILFNNERDLGIMFTYQPSKESRYHFLKVEAALVNGTGKNNPEFDDQKDFIGRISITQPLMSETAKLGVGLSYYRGGFRSDTTVSYAMENGTFIKSVQQDAIQQIMPRNLYSADAQFTIATQLGYTTLRVEYTAGLQSSQSVNSSIPQNTLLTPVSAATAKPAYYKRNLNGGYFYFVQAIGQTKHSVVFKYDWFDPNTEVKGNEINPANGLTAGDVKFTTLGVGYLFRMSEHVKFTAYYDFIENETSANLSGYQQDLRDNLLTLRVQYRF